MASISVERKALSIATSSRVTGGWLSALLESVEVSIAQAECPAEPEAGSSALSAFAILSETSSISDFVGSIAIGNQRGRGKVVRVSIHFRTRTLRRTIPENCLHDVLSPDDLDHSALNMAQLHLSQNILGVFAKQGPLYSSSAQISVESRPLRSSLITSASSADAVKLCA